MIVRLQKRLLLSKRKPLGLQKWSFGHGYILAIVLIKYSIYDHCGVHQFYKKSCLIGDLQ